MSKRAMDYLGEKLQGSAETIKKWIQNEIHFTSESSLTITQLPHYLGHEPVRFCALLVFEVNVRVVVAHQLVEALRMARYLSFGPAARAQIVFGDVGHVLLVGQRCEPARPRAHAVSRTGPAAVHQQPRAGARSRQQAEARSRRHLVVRALRTARGLRGASATALSTFWHFSARQYFPQLYREPKLAMHGLPGTGGCKS